MTARTRMFIVHGRPRPQGSLRTLLPKRGSKPVTMASDPGVYVYRSDIRSAYEERFGGCELLHGSVELSITFIFRRPDNHYMPPAKTKSRGKRQTLRKDAPVHYTSTPDVDKLIRAVGDALTNIAYEDDKQVTLVTAEKRWGDEDRTTIWVDERAYERPVRDG